ncbi:MAG: hypothetical protein VW270_15470 [Candidatus Poseidoniales archaeon]
MNTKSYDKAFVTGCDSTNEWMLPWFFEHYHQHTQTPLLFADFGITDRELVKPHVHAIIDLTKISERAWFKKPKALIHSPATNLVWLDTDIQIMKPIDEIFDLLKPNVLNMVQDRPWAKRRGGVQFNSGVVGIINKTLILGMWADWCKHSNEPGDQETLTANLNPITQLTYINELPNEYNHLRLQIENDNEPADNAKMIHWTGPKGKDRIRAMIHG